MELFGIRLVGVNPITGQKLLMSLAFIGVVLVLRWTLERLTSFLLKRSRNERLAFWRRQSISLITTLLIVLSVISIWFDDPRRLTTGLGLVTAGLAFALQKVITAFAGYLVIMRGRTFHVGERITMGGVRGDVISLGFLHTTIMEMGQPHAVQGADPAMWIRGRQYTGRIVTVTNDKIFEEPIFNYTRDFPFIWEELGIPVKYTSDWRKAERILLGAARMHTEEFQKQSAPVRELMQERYFIRIDDLIPRVFCRLTDNWIELSVRFIVPEHGIRDLKDAISRTVLGELQAAGIEIASTTVEVVGLPRMNLQLENGEGRGAA